MAAFAISSYVLQAKQKKMDDNRRINLFNVIMGDGVSTYPAGGLAVNSASLACWQNLDRLVVVDNGQKGLEWVWDSVNNKLRAYVTGTGSGVALSELATGATLPTHTILVEAIGF